jgi:hypothetical protein
MRYLSLVTALVLVGFLPFVAPVLANDRQENDQQQELTTDQQHAAQPGTLNYLEGQATLGPQTLTPDSIGKVRLDPGQTLTTQDGKAEILLTPGVFARLGESTVATMISSTTTNTRMAVEDGEAFMEVDEVHPYNDLRILQDGSSIQLVKMGLYNFNANLHLFRVLDGEAVVDNGEKTVKVKSGEQVDLAAQPLRAKKFDRKEVEAEDLYRWTSLRSSYLAEANVDYAPKYMYGGFGWFGDGWYWDPWFDAYTFLPGDGIFYSSFGWGFYSPFCVFGAPFFFSSHSHHHFNHFSHLNRTTSATMWGPGAHYRVPMNHGNHGHDVLYAAGFKAHNSWGGGKGPGFHGGYGHGGAFHNAFHGGGFHGGGFHGGGFGGGGGHK